MENVKSIAGCSIGELVATSKPFLVFFKSELCEYCKALEPAINILKKRYGDRLGFYLLDVNEQQEAVSAVKDYINGVPSVLLFEGDNFVSLKDPEYPDPYMWYTLSYVEDFIKEVIGGDDA